MKWFEILRGRIDKKDYLTVNIHNPLWILIGFVAGMINGILSTHAYYMVEKLIKGGE